MTLTEYMHKAMDYRLESSNAHYVRLNFIGEVGELYSKLAKEIRDDMFFPDEELKKELGDIAWLFVALIQDLNFDPDEILQMNLDKLAQRRINGTIQGSGDSR